MTNEKLNAAMTLEDADGEIPYNMTNDYMFRAVLQKDKKVLKGLVGALLHLDPETLEVEITNPIELGQSFDNKEFILDTKVLVDGRKKVNLEMQVINYHNWTDRSLSYLCRSFDDLSKGEDYGGVTPVVQVSFLDFVLFPEAPEFYATYMMINTKNHMVYTDKMKLSVVQLCNVELATEEDRLYGIDKWAALFKAKTWKELKAVAATNQFMESAVSTIFELSSDENVRERCRARAEYEAWERYREKKIAQQETKIVELENENAQQGNTIVELAAEIARLRAELDKRQ